MGFPELWLEMELNALGFAVQAFDKSANWGLLSSCCDCSDLHISLYK